MEEQNHSTHRDRYDRRDSTEDTPIASARYRIIVASILLSISVIEIVLDGLALFDANETLVAAQMGLGSLLLGLGLFKTNRHRG